MNFSFATATQIIFGWETAQQVTQLTQVYGKRILLITGTKPARYQAIIDRLEANSESLAQFPVDNEPTIECIEVGVSQAKSTQAQVIISIGGGSVLDAGKAISALATNDGHPLDYLEVIGKGQNLIHPPLPFIAIPTTAGTGAEVTKNAVLKSEEHQRKVSLRDNRMIPQVAIIDPQLTLTVPRNVTASTGMDALTQILEPFVSHLANPLTDALCREGLARASQSLFRVVEDGSDAEARTNMALVSLLGGMALANAKLGAVHGFAGVLGGMYPAPHGAICARLLPPVIQINVRALSQRDPDNPALERYNTSGHILTGDSQADTQDAIVWIQEAVSQFDIPRLREYGIQQTDFAVIVEKSANSSSMKGNPIQLTTDELIEILQSAW